MELTPVLAGRLVKKLEATQPYNVGVINADGVVVAASDPRVLGKRHEDATQRLQEFREVAQDVTAIRVRRVKERGNGRCLFVRNQLVGAVGLSGREEQVAPYLEMARAIAEMMLEREFDIQKDTIQNASRAQILMRLLSCHSDQNRLREALRSQHIDPRIPRTILAVKFAPLADPATLQERQDTGALFHNAVQNIQSLFEMRFTFKEDLIIPDGESGIFFVLCADRGHHATQCEKKLFEICNLMVEDIRDNYRLDARVVLGPRCSSIEDYRGQYHQMLEIFRIGEHMFPQLKILSGNSLVLGNITSYIPDSVKNQIVEYTFRNILDHPQKALYLETLDAYFKNNMNISETAQSLYIHRNTLQHRFKRIEELTGYCVYQLEDILTLRLAFLFYDMTRG